MRNVDDITDCQGRISSMCETRKNELEEYARGQISQLEAMKTCLQETVRQCAESVKAQLLDDSFSGNNLGHLVWQASRSSTYSELCLFEYREVSSTSDVLELIPVEEWQSKITSRGISDDYAILNPMCSIKAGTSRLEGMEFQDFQSLMETCGELASEYHAPYEAFIRFYTKHYFIGSKIVEETRKNKIGGNILRRKTGSISSAISLRAFA